ncbi:hypothetical protein NEMBOFW57_002206 [Staphylotrichum longicolle]|uniref:Uncharacterized protein n=1 Tax=Staphylotrichum longicolle TaxID=669026 RepID=A0AAD4I2A6_9PEZI|nr:hypothetical protein NEMBOFW57_002206 [Staphylotrichum longicolle]
MDSPNRQPEWLKWGFVLTWLPKLAPTSRALPRATYTVTLILFQPPVETMERLIEFAISPNWTDATIDPHVLVDIALVSWYDRIDKVSWEVTNLVRTDEEDVFRRTRVLGSTTNAKEPTAADFDLHLAHTSAKNAVFMIEALDAAIRLADSALADHEASEQAFHINIAHDSRVNIQNSRSVRLIAIVGLIFIPFGAITAIFGTQFFNSTGDGHLNLSSDFWILWAIAIPVTVVSLAVWKATERHDNQLPWGSALSSVPRWWMDGRRWAGRETGGGTGSEEVELRDIADQLV